MTRAAAKLRESLDHPVIDSDGHALEFLPAVRDRMRALGGADAVDGFEAVLAGIRHYGALSNQQRRALGVFRPPWWGFPTRNTLDRATAILPALLRERLDELGIDFAVIYPTYGLFALSLEPDELRQACARAFNEYFAESYAEYRDRLCPAALIPMNSPEEALDELDYAVTGLGLRVVVLAGHALRPPPVEGDLPRSARWLDTFGLDSPHDYDAVWARCVELGVAPTFHSSGMGWGSRASVTNYIYNHLGNFAAAGEATCRGLLMGGVPRRFPELRFAFLEGGVGWACNLYSDLVGHWDKRNRHALANYDPAELDRAELARLFERYASKAFLDRRDELEASVAVLSNPHEDVAMLDEFAASGIEAREDIRDVFARSFHFGCEADDPLNALAFDSRLHPMGARFKALFGSDIGHWDVPDMRDVLPEAFELVERRLITPEDFRAFVFENPASMWTDANPQFFAGTCLEAIS